MKRRYKNFKEPKEWAESDGKNVWWYKDDIQYRTLQSNDGGIQDIVWTVFPDNSNKIQPKKLWICQQERQSITVYNSEYGEVYNIPQNFVCVQIFSTDSIGLLLQEDDAHCWETYFRALYEEYDVPRQKQLYKIKDSIKTSKRYINNNNNNNTKIYYLKNPLSSPKSLIVLDTLESITYNTLLYVHPKSLFIVTYNTLNTHHTIWLIKCINSGEFEYSTKPEYGLQMLGNIVYGPPTIFLSIVLNTIAVDNYLVDAVVCTATENLHRSVRACAHVGKDKNINEDDENKNENEYENESMTVDTDASTITDTDTEVESEADTDVNKDSDIEEDNTEKNEKTYNDIILYGLQNTTLYIISLNILEKSITVIDTMYNVLDMSIVEPLPLLHKDITVLCIQVKINEARQEWKLLWKNETVLQNTLPINKYWYKIVEYSRTEIYFINMVDDIKILWELPYNIQWIYKKGLIYLFIQILKKVYTIPKLLLKIFELSELKMGTDSEQMFILSCIFNNTVKVCNENIINNNNEHDEDNESWKKLLDSRMNKTANFLEIIDTVESSKIDIKYTFYKINDDMKYIWEILQELYEINRMYITMDIYKNDLCTVLLIGSLLQSQYELAEYYSRQLYQPLWSIQNTDSVIYKFSKYIDIKNLFIITKTIIPQQYILKKRKYKTPLIYDESIVRLPQKYEIYKKLLKYFIKPKINDIRILYKCGRYDIAKTLNPPIIGSLEGDTTLFKISLYKINDIKNWQGCRVSNRVRQQSSLRFISIDCFTIIEDILLPKTTIDVPIEDVELSNPVIQLEQQTIVQTYIEDSFSRIIGRGALTVCTWYTPQLCTSLEFPILLLEGKTKNSSIIELNIPSKYTHDEFISWATFHNAVTISLQLIFYDTTTIDESIIKSSSSLLSGIQIGINRGWIMHHLHRLVIEQNSTQSSTLQYCGQQYGISLQGYGKQLLHTDYLQHLSLRTLTSTTPFFHCISQIAAGISYVSSSNPSQNRLLCTRISIQLPSEQFTIDDITISDITQVGAIIGLGFLEAGKVKIPLIDTLLQHLQIYIPNDKNDVIYYPQYIQSLGFSIGAMIIGTENILIINIIERTLREELLSPCYKILDYKTSDDTSTYYNDDIILCNLPYNKLKKITVPTHIGPIDTISNNNKTNKYILNTHKQLSILIVLICNGIRTKNKHIINQLKDFLYFSPHHRACTFNLAIVCSMGICIVDWISIDEQKVWLYDTKIYKNNTTIDDDTKINISSISLIVLGELIGRIWGIGICYAGSNSILLKDILLEFLNYFIELLYTLKKVKKSTYIKIQPRIIHTCITMIFMSISLIMSGSGDIELIKLVLPLTDIKISLSQNHKSSLYWSFGILFLGYSRYSLTVKDIINIYWLLLSTFPLYPIGINDPIRILEPFKHLYVLSMEPRIQYSIDITSNLVVRVPIKINIEIKDVKNKILNKNIIAITPCLLPPLETIKTISVLPYRYYPYTIDIKYIKYHTIFVQKRTHSLSYNDDPYGFKPIFSKEKLSVEIVSGIKLSNILLLYRSSKNDLISNELFILNNNIQLSNMPSIYIEILRYCKLHEDPRLQRSLLMSINIIQYLQYLCDILNDKIDTTTTTIPLDTIKIQLSQLPSIFEYFQRLSIDTNKMTKVSNDNDSDNDIDSETTIQDITNTYTYTVSKIDTKNFIHFSTYSFVYNTLIYTFENIFDNSIFYNLLQLHIQSILPLEWIQRKQLYNKRFITTTTFKNSIMNILLTQYLLFYDIPSQHTLIQIASLLRNKLITVYQNIEYNYQKIIINLWQYFINSPLPVRFSAMRRVVVAMVPLLSLQEV